MARRIERQCSSAPRLDIKTKNFSIPVYERLRVITLDENAADAGDVTCLFCHSMSLTSESKRDRHPEMCKLLEHDDSPVMLQDGWTSSRGTGQIVSRTCANTRRSATAAYHPSTPLSPQFCPRCSPTAIRSNIERAAPNRGMRA